MSEFNFFSLKCDVGVRLVFWRRSLGLLPLARENSYIPPHPDTKSYYTFFVRSVQGGVIRKFEGRTRRGL